ncbi:MAG: RecX family transcriptional regulator [Alistipes sp.]|nr:RecX family transcriptional regulator [Alistipes sp.]
MLPTKPKVKRPKTAEQALASLMRLCARAERSSGDAMRLMATWMVPEADRQGVLQRLIKERFIDDSRYAEAFVREKANLSAWGEYKIRATLRRKGIADSIISEALRQIPSEQALERLTERLKRKLRTTKYDTTYQLKTKLLRYALSLGFSMDESMRCVEEVMQNIDNENECDEFFF